MGLGAVPLAAVQMAAVHTTRTGRKSGEQGLRLSRETSTVLIGNYASRHLPVQMNENNCTVIGSVDPSNSERLPYDRQSRYAAHLHIESVANAIVEIVI